MQGFADLQNCVTLKLENEQLKCKLNVCVTPPSSIKYFIISLW